MPNTKLVLSVVAIILTFVGYIPYYRDIIKGTTRPHIYSWLVWSILSMIIFGLQITNGAGAGSFVVLTAGLLCIGVFALGLKNGTRDITRQDTIFFVVALIALVLWLFAKQPVLSSILITITDMFSFLPTLIKGYRKPYTETLSFYALTSLRYILTILSLGQYNLVTALDPILVWVANVVMSVTLIIRRKVVAKDE